MLGWRDEKMFVLGACFGGKNGSLRVRWAEHIADPTVVPPTRYDSNSYAHTPTKALSSEKQILVQPKVVRQKLGGPVAYLSPAQNSTALRYFSLRPYSDSIPVFRSMPPADSAAAARQLRPTAHHATPSPAAALSAGGMERNTGIESE